jgi:hypothetical protein
MKSMKISNLCDKYNIHLYFDTHFILTDHDAFQNTCNSDSVPANTKFH